MTAFRRTGVVSKGIVAWTKRCTAVMQRVNRSTLIVGALLLAIEAPVYGSTITEDVKFTADMFQVGVGSKPAPVDPVIGEFKITLDPTVATVDDTADISLISLNIVLGSQLSFTYKPTADSPYAAGTLRVGGLFDTADAVQYSPSTNDFWLQIGNFATTPTFIQVGYSQTSVSGANLFYTLNATGTVDVSQLSSSVPEPTSLCLVGLGLASLTVRQLRLKRKGH
jgi:hypothetical protein